MVIKIGQTGKEGIFKTLEALIAIFVTFAFLAVFIPQQREHPLPESPANILASLRENDGFRNCVVLQNLTCINQSIERNLDDSYDYMVNLSNDPSATVSGLPQKRVYANAIFISGNTTNATRTIMRLYYWPKE